MALLAACSGSGDGGTKGKGTPEVGFEVVRHTTVPLTVELPGRVSAWRIAEVRPQISGVVERKLFAEGTLVHAGQPLYQIDPSLYRAAANQAAANLSSAQASAEAASAKAERYRPLAAEEAVAKQDYTDAAAAARQARAAVAQSRAALDTAKINLRFTRVPAPITGRIGRSLVTEGALVTSDQAAPLAVISVLDPIYVDIQQSATDLLHLRRQLAKGGAAPAVAEVHLRLDDGSDYGPAGRVEFSEVTTDTQTGTVTLRARFPNPQGLLLPGMFVRARFAQSAATDAFLVPQIAVSRDTAGNAQVYVVGKDDKVELRQVSTQQTVGDKWVVTSGLADGDRIVTQGLGKVKPGQKVKPVAETAPQKIGDTTTSPAKPVQGV